MLIPFRRSSDRKLHPSRPSRPLPGAVAALRRRPLLEDLEGRQMLSTFTVTSATDSTATAMGTLRWAITQSNDTDGPNTINFKISNSGLQKIELQSPLPPITTPVNIDGLSQNTYAGDTSATPLIQIDGTDAGAAPSGSTSWRRAPPSAACRSPTSPTPAWRSSMPQTSISVTSSSASPKRPAISSAPGERLLRRLHRWRVGRSTLEQRRRGRL